jgi:hypothetical protein
MLALDVISSTEKPIHTVAVTDYTKELNLGVR